MVKNFRTNIYCAQKLTLMWFLKVQSKLNRNRKAKQNLTSLNLCLYCCQWR